MPANLTETLKAIERTKAACGAAGPNEYRLHPDDIKSLKRQARLLGEHQEVFSAYGGTYQGIRIIPDADAPRLPRT